MTNDDVRRAQQRIADAREQSRAAIDAGAPAPAPAQDRNGAPFVVGDRVLNLRGGAEGEVDRVEVADRSGVAWIWVRFDDGSRSRLTATDLLARPTPPAPRR
jgi:hypothetical protein